MQRFRYLVVWNLNFPTTDEPIASCYLYKSRDEIDISILNIFPAENERKTAPAASRSLRDRCRIFGMHLHEESLELSRAIATRFVSTILNVYMGIYLLLGIYCAFVKNVRREYQFPEEIQTSLVKLVRRSQDGFKLPSRYLTAIVIRISLHRVRNKTVAFVKCIRTTL